MKSLKRWREERGFSQEKLAWEVGVSTRSIARYEAIGLATASFETVIKITEVLDIKLDQLETK